MAAPWKGADAVEWPDDEDEVLEEAPAEIEGDFVLPVAADDVVRSDDEEDHLDVDPARVGLDFDELDELDNNHEFQQFLTNEAAGFFCQRHTNHNHITVQEETGKGRFIAAPQLTGELWILDLVVA